MHVHFVHAIEDSHLINHQTRDLKLLHCYAYKATKIRLSLKKKEIIFQRAVESDISDCKPMQLNIYWISGANYIQAHFEHCMLMHNHDISA